MNSVLTKLGGSLHRLCILAYPAAFRKRYGRALHQTTEDVFTHSAGFSSFSHGITILAECIATLREGLGRRIARNASPGNTARARSPRMDSMIVDIKYAVRSLRKHRGSTVVVVATLAIAIGFNTAIFSVVDSILFRPLPFPRPEKLVAVWADYTVRSGREREWLSYPNFHDLRESADIFEDVAVYQGWGGTLTSADGAEIVTGAQFSHGMFSNVLAVAPALGRGLTEADDKPGAPNVVLISDGMFRRRFNAETGAIGQFLTINGEQYTIIGVMPARFSPPFLTDADVWRPMRLNMSVTEGRRGQAVMRSMARLKPGISIERANLVARQIGARLEQDYREDNAGVSFVIFPLRADMVRQAHTAMLVLLGAVGLILLIACVNVTNVLLSRASSRTTEVAVRVALGAGRRRIIVQHLLESAFLGLAGGALGISLAFLTTPVLVRLAPDGTPRLDGIAVDFRILLFATAITLLAALVSGLVPALRAGQVNPQAALSEGGRGADASRPARHLRATLVAVQMAFALVLLAGSGLLLKSFKNLSHLNLGFDPKGVATFSIFMPPAGYPEGYQRAAFVERILPRLQSIPGVSFAAATSTLPLSSNNSDTNFEIEGNPPPDPGKEKASWIRFVTPDYFKAMGIQLTAGRFFTESEDSLAPRVVIINETMAERYFPNRNPIGLRLNFNDPANPRWREIVGVARDIHNFGIRPDRRNSTYFPYAQVRTSFVSIVIKTGNDPAGVLPQARAELKQLDPTIAPSDAGAMTDVVRESLGPDRFVALLVSLFAAVALLLATVGVYGVVSYDANQRRHEMGIRIALGASGTDVKRLVVAGSARLAVAGIGAGILIAFLAGRLLKSLLFGISSADPSTYAVVSLILIVVSVAAAMIPAHHASRVDPIRVLNAE